MEFNPTAHTPRPALLHPSFKNRSHLSHRSVVKPDNSPRPLTLGESLRPRAGTPILRLPTPLSSFANSFSRLGLDTQRSQAATPIPKTGTPVPQTASTTHLEPFPDFGAVAVSTRASLNSSRPPSSRVPSATPQRSRKRKQVTSRRLYYSALSALQLLVLAIPITTLLLFQALANGKFLVPYLIPFFLIVGLAIATGAGVATLWSKRRKRRKQKKRKVAIEIEKWKTLAREKSREVEVVGWAAERLRGGLRSLSRSRGVSEVAKGTEGDPRARSKDGRPRQDSKARSKRSVSRGRTGRAKANEEVWELDGQGVSHAATVQPQGKGSVARGREAAATVKERRETAATVKERREAALIGIQITAQKKPASIKSVATTLRRSDLDKPLPPLPLKPSRSSLAGRWTDSPTGAPFIQEKGPTNPLLRQLLEPIESASDETTASGFRPTIIDHDLLAEIQKQIIERSQSRAAKERAEQAANSSTKPQETPMTEEKKIATPIPVPVPGPAFIRGLDIMQRYDSDLSDDGEGEEDKDEMDHASRTSDDDSPDSPLEIMRGGHGGMGSSQSDDNFESSHALDEDAISMSSSVREAKRAESLHKVTMWASRSAISIPGINDETGNGENLHRESREEHEGIAGSADSRGESTENRRSMARHMSRSIHDLRQRFDEWVSEKRDRSRGRTWSITGR